MRESIEFFGVEGVLIGGIGNGVSETVVDLRESCGVGVAQIGDLDGGYFSSQDRETVTGGVTSEIDQDIELMGLDEVAEF